MYILKHCIFEFYLFEASLYHVLAHEQYEAVMCLYSQIIENFFRAAICIGYKYVLLTFIYINNNNFNSTFLFTFYFDLYAASLYHILACALYVALFMFRLQNGYLKN